MEQWFENKEIIDYPEIKLIGLKERTSYQNEINLPTSKISSTIQKYYMGAIANKIPGRKNPGVSYAVYANYSSDEFGEYDYFFGEEVSSLDNIPEGLSSLIMPASRRVKYTTKPGQMPGVIINAWQNIWLSKATLGGERLYDADFEIYDQRAINPMSAIVDIYIGIK